MKTKLLFTMLIFSLFSILTFAQAEKSIKEKLKEVKEAKKITITTDKGEVVFEGDEADKVLEKLKSKEMKRIKIVTDGDEILTEDFEGIDGENVMIWKSEGGEEKIIKHKGKGHKMMMFMDDDDDIKFIENNKTVKVEVNEDNGEKTVTVKTKENGEEKVETYKGKEAEEYLKKMEKDNEMIIDVEFDSDEDFNWVSSDSDSNQIEKRVEVKIEDGKKKVTVTTTKNGEDKVEVFEGDEADKFLKVKKMVIK